ncbi:MAG TPA: acyloxyacyl hydrolase [Terriglobales bacterium]|nr:acyloxyacyl hydrolase [Terriglobales bacterium]
MVSRLAVFFLIFLIAELAPAQSAPSPANFRTDAFHEGGNEYEVWSGYSPSSLQWIGKSEGRRLFMAGFGWRRVILASNSVAWKFTVDTVPIALVSQPTIVLNQIGTFQGQTFTCGGPLTQETVQEPSASDISPCFHPGRRVTRGIGLEPVGFDFNFRRRHRFQPVVGINGGFLKFTRDVPVADSNSFNFTFSLRGAIQIFTNESHSITIGYRFHHISNANTGNPFNPGIDSNFIYAGCSFHK